MCCRRSCRRCSCTWNCWVPDIELPKCCIGDGYRFSIFLLTQIIIKCNLSFSKTRLTTEYISTSKSTIHGYIIRMTISPCYICNDYDCISVINNIRSISSVITYHCRICSCIVKTDVGSIATWTTNQTDRWIVSIEDKQSQTKIRYFFRKWRTRYWKYRLICKDSTNWTCWSLDNCGSN